MTRLGERHATEDGCYWLILLANVDEQASDMVTARSYRLGLWTNVEYDPEQGTYELKVGDCVRLFVVVTADSPDGLEGVSIARLNLVAWTSARAQPRQVFGTCFRNTGDAPDEQILTRGMVDALALDGPVELKAGAFYPEPGDDSAASRRAKTLADGSALAFEVTVPNRIELVKQGLFEFLASVTIDGTPQGRMNFIVDPEMDVGGGYPP